MVAANQPYWICAQTGITPLGIGMPGVGKTQSVYAFAKAMGRHCYTLIASLRDPADVGGYPYPGEITIPLNGDGRKKMVMRLIPPQWAAACWDRSNGGWIIFFDELTTCAPAVQSALLRVIAEKVVGDIPLPGETLFLAACNPPEQAANGIELEAAMAMGRLIEQAAERRPTPLAIVVVSDGITPWPSQQVRPNVVACLTRRNCLESVPKWIASVCIEKDESC